jgi:glucosamine kinase
MRRGPRGSAAFPRHCAPRPEGPRGISPYNGAVPAPSPASRRSPARPRGEPTRWAVGVDAGGTWIRVEARSDAGARRALTARARGPAPIEAALRGAWRRWRLTSRVVDGLAVGSRGVWTARERKEAARRLAGLATRVRVIADVEAAHHGALGGTPGILLLAGTGSIALGRDARGRWARAGGLGPLLGDEGSAFAIGRDWLAADAARGLTPRARAIILAPDAVARVAALAPVVLARARRGDRRARRAVAGAQTALAGLGLDLARRLRLAPPVAMSWAGGLMTDAPFRAGVWRAMRRAGLAVAPQAPRAAAIEAATALAVALGPRRKVAAAPARATTAAKPRARGHAGRDGHRVAAAKLGGDRRGRQPSSIAEPGEPGGRPGAMALSGRGRATESDRRRQ